MGSEPSEEKAASYRVEDLVVDVGRARVTRGDAELPLPRLSFDVLVALVEASPNLVTLDGLMNEVWPGQVVSPETVSQRVKLLRSALGDDPRRPRYIVGVRGRGYRLTNAAVRLDPATGSATVVALPAAGKRQSPGWL